MSAIVTSTARVPSLSAFFPAYNEERNVPMMVERMTAVLARVADDYEIIVVDDGSADRTGAVADELAAADPHVRVVHHPVNRGYGGALKSGFAASRKAYVFFTDGDGQFDVAEIERLLPFVPEYDVVVGYRLDRAEGGLRKLNAAAWNGLVHRLFHIPVRDVDCAFKLFKREVFDMVRVEAEGAMISTEVLARAVRAGFRVHEVGVHHYERRHGTPTGANPLVIVRAFYELFKLYRRITADGARGRA
ncbi:MAG: glycosyltransferase family 2 protein [Deltaproteobacteria bacterium]|nr:glycosyltransferase family 2 protein [Deltaproteobacteria bacterium]